MRAAGWVVVLGFMAAQALPAHARPDDAAAVAEARRHFTRGSALYKLGDHQQALAEFRAAYSLSPAPGLLFNMGQAARADQQWDLASHYFQAYLRAVPDAPERDYVEAQLVQMAPLLSPSPPRAEVSAPPEIVAASPATRNHSRGRGLRIAGITTAGVGVAVVVTAVWFGVRASDAAGDVSQAYRDGASYGPELEERYRVGRRDEKIAIGTGVAGAALVAGGAVLWYLGFNEGLRKEVLVAPQRGGLAVGWSCAF